MTAPYLWNSTTLNALVTHLWQSTAFAVLAWIFTLALRNYPARARFWVLMAASIKFLVPFALLTALGIHCTRPNSPGPKLAILYTVIEEVNQPFASNLLPAQNPAMPAHTPVSRSGIVLALGGIWLFGCVVMFVRWAWQWQSASRLVNGAVALVEGREVDVLRQYEADAQIREPVPVLVISRSVEPGIFGIVRPVLMWPAGLSDRLDDAHIASIVAHEVEHIRRRDNLTAMIHRFVEAVFWFHPAIWWMGAKMTEERERACDEMVLEHNAEPQKYADSILKVCAFCLEPPLPCASGVSGSDLKKRVLRITSHRSAALTLGRRAVLMAAAILALTLPIGLGVVRGQSATEDARMPKSRNAFKPPQFDVVSIKPTPSSDDKTLVQQFPDTTSFHGAPVRIVLRTAFGVEDDHIIGAPSWVSTNRYDIDAKVAPEDAPKLDNLKAGDRNAMLIPLLTERFNLKYHHETRDLSMYALTVANGGPRLTKGDPDPPPGEQVPQTGPDHPGDPTKEHHRMLARPGYIEADSVPMFVLAGPLTQYLGRSVVDKTGLTGNYTFTLRWTPDNAPFPVLIATGALGTPADAENAAEAARLSLFTAVQEQLGLKLESRKSSADVIVIDHIDPPSPN